MKRPAIAVAALLAVAPATLFGLDDLFLRLNSYFLPGSAARVRVPLLDGDFTTGARTIDPRQLSEIAIASAAGREIVPADAWERAPDGSFVAVALGAPGTYAVGAATRTRVVPLGARAFNAMLRESGLLDELAARTTRGELDRPVRARRTEHVKAVFQKGAPRTTGAERALGHAAELVPAANPYSLGVGDTLVVRCVVDGRPAPGAAVTAGGVRPTGAVIAARRVRADSAGLARIPLVAPGRWYAKFTHLERFAGDRAAEYESKSATLTFGVKE